MMVEALLNTRKAEAEVAKANEHIDSTLISLKTFTASVKSLEAALETLATLLIEHGIITRDELKALSEKKLAERLAAEGEGTNDVAR
jgi:hypothetical protein